MNEKAKNLWVKALRSGEFQQGFGQLYNPKTDSYCVLGLLCMLGMVNGACNYEEINERGYFDKHHLGLPHSIVSWAGLKDAKIFINKDFISLSGYNDLGRFEFDQLADIIEENWRDM